MKKLKITDCGGVFSTSENKHNAIRALHYVLTPVFCALVCLGAVFLFKNNKVYAATETKVSELTINGSGKATDGFVFERTSLDTLYNKILNVDEGGTLAEIKTKLSGVEDRAGAGEGISKMLDSASINGGSLLNVDFGGMEWQVTSVTTADDDVIATLWLTDNNEVDDSCFSYGNYYTNTEQEYSTCIYGTSYMRVVMLNAGGRYVAADKNKIGTISDTQEQDPNNQFAQFTMTGVADNLTKYIVKPEKVVYQSQESWAGTEDKGAPYCYPNDTYGTPYVDDWCKTMGNCVNKTDYAAWGSDYLWLPSITEIGGKYINKGIQTGVAAQGIWNMPADTFRARQNAWTRSCDSGNYSGCLYIRQDGLFASTSTSNNGGIRPALHLNLTQAESDAFTEITQPTKGTPNVELGYTDGSIDLNNLFLKDYENLPEIANVHAAATEGRLKWDDGQSPALGENNYFWTFTPTEEDKYDTVSGYETLTFKEVVIAGLRVTKKDGVDIYDRFDGTAFGSLDEYLKSRLTVIIEYSDGSTGTSPLGTDEYRIITDDISVTSGESQIKTIEVAAFSEADPAIDGATGQIETEVKRGAIEYIDIQIKDEVGELTYPMTLAEVKACYEAYVKFNFAPSVLLVDEGKVAVALKNGGGLKAGTSTLTFTYSDDGLSKSEELEVTIAKGTYDVDGITFAGETVVYDGGVHSIVCGGNLPAGVGVEYAYSGDKQSAPFGFTAVGEYDITLSFTQTDTDNYNLITQTKIATLKIIEATVTGITASVERGTNFDVTDTLDDLKPHITVTKNFSGNYSENVTEFTLDCATLREGGLLEVGKQTVGVKFVDTDGAEYSATVSISVNKATAVRPVYNGLLSYTGGTIKPEAADFDGFDDKIMTFVESKLQSGVLAGAYSAVFALTDTARYEWESAFADAGAFDGEEAEAALSANEIAVKWNVEKAVVSATRKEGELPVFKSDSYNGAWDNAVAIIYYVDESCTTEVAEGELEAGKRYYVMIELVDEANFAMDDSFENFTVSPFAYTVPAPAPTTDESESAALKPDLWWVVLIVAIFAAIFVTVTVVVFVRHYVRKSRKGKENENDSARG